MKKAFVFLLVCALTVLLLPGQQVIYMRRAPVAAGGGGITKTVLTSGVDTGSRDFTTASVSPTANAHIYLFAGFARTNTGTVGDLAGCTGPTGVTWTNITPAAEEWGFRRKFDVLRGAVNGSPSSGTISCECDEGSSCAGPDDGSVWAVIQLEGLDSGTPNGTVTMEACDDTQDSNPSITVSGTPGASDWIITAFAWEDTDTLTVDSDFGTTDANPSDTNTGVRQIIGGTNSSPPASPVPDVSGTGSNHSCGASFIVNAA